MKKLINAFRFMTIIPFPGGAHADLGEAGKSAAFFSIVGLFIGAVLCSAAFAALRLWPPVVVSVILTSLWVILTAGLHIDGLADLADGLGGGWDRESRLRIMKDSSIGTYGALAVGLLLMLKAVFIYQAVLEGITYSVLLLVPATARAAQVLSIRIFKPARTEGFGAVFRGSVSRSGVSIAALIALAALTGVWGWIGIAAAGGVFLFMLSAGGWIAGRLGGLNGDAYGAICELTEVFMLIGLSVLRPEYNGWFRTVQAWLG